jgi:hypothetical protein
VVVVGGKEGTMLKIDVATLIKSRRLPRHPATRFNNADQRQRGFLQPSPDLYAFNACIGMLTDTNRAILSTHYVPTLVVSNSIYNYT